jgi:hypothetical protein
VSASNPLKTLEKLPVPVPSEVLVKRDTVGLAVVLHTIPRALTSAPPSSAITPPLLALPDVILLMEEVVRLGSLVVLLSSFLQLVEVVIRITNNQGINLNRWVLFIKTIFCE